MLIVCQTCATSYDIDVASLQPNGRQVRCARCRTVWHAVPSQAQKLLAAAGALGPAQRMAAVAARPVAAERTPQPQPHAKAPAAAAREPEGLDHPVGEAPHDGVSPQPPDDGFDAGWMAAADEVSLDALDQTLVTEAPSIAPLDFDDGAPPLDAGDERAAAARGGDDDAKPRQDIETYAARRRQPRHATRSLLRWPLSLLQSGILVLVIIDAVIIGWRSDVVRLFPQTASFYAAIGLAVNLRGLTFEDITTTTEHHDGVPILIVEGSIANGSRTAVEVPRLKFVVRNSSRQEIYSWTAVPSRAVLPPNGSVAFRTRLASPPVESRDVLVRFITRNDILVGTR